MTKTERNKLKKLLHQLVVARDKKCIRCGRNKRLNASHIYPKGVYKDLEFEPWNLKALCFHCHIFWWHKDVLEASRWFKQVYPDRYKKVQRLYNKSNKVGKVKVKKVYDFDKIRSKLERQIKKCLKD